MFDYASIDKIFAELFKKANDFDFHTNDLKKSIENLNKFC